VGEIHRLDRREKPTTLSRAVTAYLSTLDNPEQQGTRKAYRTTLRALIAEFTGDPGEATKKDKEPLRRSGP